MIFTRKFHIVAFTAATTLALCFIGAFFSLAKAAPPPGASCSGVPAAYCVAVPMHGVNPDDPQYSVHVTRYVVFHEDDVPGKLNAYYMISDTSVLTEVIGSPWFKPGKYYNKSLDIDPLVNWDGTTVFSGTHPFSVQNLNPDGSSCPDNVWEGRCDFLVYIPPGSERYSILNTGSVPVSQTHEIYRGGSLYATIHHEVAPFSLGRFTIPTPTATLTPQPTPEGTTATPTPTQTLAQARAAQAAQASGAAFEVRVTNPTPTATATATPPPTGPQRVYIPLVTR